MTDWVYGQLHAATGQQNGFARLLCKIVDGETTGVSDCGDLAGRAVHCRRDKCRKGMKVTTGVGSLERCRAPVLQIDDEDPRWKGVGLVACDENRLVRDGI